MLVVMLIGKCRYILPIAFVSTGPFSSADHEEVSNNVSGFQTFFSISNAGVLMYPKTAFAIPELWQSSSEINRMMT